MKNKNLIVAGIDTEVGKTIAAAILVEALQADYWKPVQSGTIETSDTNTVRNLVSNSKSVFHQESYTFKEPISPHAAAKVEGKKIEAERIALPHTTNHLIVELAGGLMSPLNEEFLNIDLVKQFNLPVVLVSKYYLGSINHTLLSIFALRQYHVKIEGLIFNGKVNVESRKMITEYANLPILFEIDEEKNINKEVVKKYAHAFKV